MDFRMQAVRVRDNAVETAIIDFINPDTGSSVSVACAIHVGSRCYYAGLASYLSDREANGAQIHYEAIGAAPSDLDATDPTLSRKVKLLEQRLDDTALLVETVLPVVQQRTTMPRPATWHNSDMNVVDVVQDMSEADLVRMATAVKKLVEVAQSYPRLMASLVTTTFRIMPITHRWQNFVPRRGGDFSRLVTRRSAVAIAGLEASLREQPGRDVVLLWGADHIQDVWEYLKRSGYRRAGIQWRRAVPLQRRGTAGPSD